MTVYKNFKIETAILAAIICPWAAAAGVYEGNTAAIVVPFVNQVEAFASQTPIISVGFNSPNAGAKGARFDVTMDTGSVGIYVGSNYFMPPAQEKNDPSYVGPGGETLTSSGVIYRGDWYKTTVNLYNPGTGVILATATVPVLAVTAFDCAPNARDCVAPTTPEQLAAKIANIAYFGVGFGQEAAGQPQGTPEKNAFLNISSTPAGVALPSPGYIITQSGVELGLTPDNTQGYAMIKLEPLLAPGLSQWQTAPISSALVTDWQKPRGKITVSNQTSATSGNGETLFDNGTSTISGHGEILFDTGVGGGYLTPPLGATVQTGSDGGTGQCNDSKPPACAVAGTTIKVAFKTEAAQNTARPQAKFNFTVGDASNPLLPKGGLNISPHGSPFLNTTFYFFNAFNYFYDAANGFIGLRALATTPEKYAKTTSGMVLDDAFACTFRWFEHNYPGLAKTNAKAPTSYSVPDTFRYYQDNGIYMGISSDGTVYARGPNDPSELRLGGLSGWLSAAKCQ